MNTPASDDLPDNAASEPGKGRPRDNISFKENRLDSRELFSGTREITIVHGDETYRLRLTAQNKLILTK